MLQGRQVSTHSLSPEHTEPGTHTLCNTNTRRAAGWWRECALRGGRGSEARLISLCGHAVFSACHHGWDSAACLLLRMHWHFSGAYPRILLSGRRLNEALPGDRGRKLHHPSGALLCAGCQPNCYRKYRKGFPSLLLDPKQHFLSAFSFIGGFCFLVPEFKYIYIYIFKRMSECHTYIFFKWTGLSGCHVKNSDCTLEKICCALCVFRRGLECKCWPWYKASIRVE